MVRRTISRPRSGAYPRPRRAAAHYRNPQNEQQFHLQASAPSVGLRAKASAKNPARRPISLVTRRRPRVTTHYQESPRDASDSPGWDSGQAGEAPFRRIRARLARIHVTADPSGSSRPTHRAAARADKSSSSGCLDDRAASAPCEYRTHLQANWSRTMTYRVRADAFRDARQSRGFGNSLLHHGLVQMIAGRRSKSWSATDPSRRKHELPRCASTFL